MKVKGWSNVVYDMKEKIYSEEKPIMIYWNDWKKAMLLKKKDRNDIEEKRSSH